MINVDAVYFSECRSEELSRGGSRIFMGGGGGALKIMRAHAHHERNARSNLQWGPGPI